MLKCKKEDLVRIDEEDIVSVRTGDFSTEVLVKDKELCRQKYADMVMEQTTLEEIMIFYVNRK